MYMHMNTKHSLVAHIYVLKLFKNNGCKFINNYQKSPPTHKTFGCLVISVARKTTSKTC